MAAGGEFTFWSTFWGELLEDSNSQYPLAVHGYENISEENKLNNGIEFANLGTAWGFVQCGEIDFTVDSRRWTVHANEWFCLQQSDFNKIELKSKTKLFLIFMRGPKGLNSMGGPLEDQGRLRYIDNCTDTVLYSPPIKGDPCLNFLCFPKDVIQTPHFHPTVRCGIVVSGQGICEVGTDKYSLSPGKIFFLPANTEHRFCTTENSFLKVIAFHPDSDYGPTHENHPMINRTWFGNKSAV